MQRTGATTHTQRERARKPERARRETDKDKTTTRTGGNKTTTKQKHKGEKQTTEQHPSKLATNITRMAQVLFTKAYAPRNLNSQLSEGLAVKPAAGLTRGA